MEKENNLSVIITTEHNLSVEMIEDIIVTAFEGGINYWCKLVKVIDFPPKMTADLSDMYASSILANGGVVRLYDAESNDVWLLNRPMVIKGIEMYCSENNVTPEGMYENHDADTADAIIQYAVFNEITFG